MDFKEGDLICTVDKDRVYRYKRPTYKNEINGWDVTDLVCKDISNGWIGNTYLNSKFVNFATEEQIAKAIAEMVQN